jgi:hypothetical protein
LAGEAAHVNPPWGGHGFNTSVGDAVNIAWKIAAVIHGWAQPQLLASYEAERRGVAEQTLACAESNMGALAGDLLADAAAIQRAKASEFYSLGLVLGYSYTGSPLVQPFQAAGPPTAGADTTGYAPTARPGDRLPHAWFPNGASLYDRLGTGFTLVGPQGPDGPEGPGGLAGRQGRGGLAGWQVPDGLAGRQGPDGLAGRQGPDGLAGRQGPDGLAARARARGIPLAFAEPPPDYPWRDDFLLVRPDQHIAWRASDPDGIDLDVVTGSATATAGRP